MLVPEKSATAEYGITKRIKYFTRLFFYGFFFTVLLLLVPARRSATAAERDQALRADLAPARSQRRGRHRVARAGYRSRVLRLQRRRYSPDALTGPGAPTAGQGTSGEGEPLWASCGLGSVPW